MKKHFLLYYLVSILILFGCSMNKQTKEDNEAGSNVTNYQEDVDKEMEEEKINNSHQAVNESTWGELPEGIKEAKNPKYPVGTKVIINAAHDAEMKGQEGVVVGAYDTIAYSVTYQPTNEDHEEVNYKWVVQEEVKGMADDPLKEHSEVIIYANRELGMKGAEGIIETVQETTVYMVDYKTKDGRNIKNYQWFIESELSKK